MAIKETKIGVISQGVDGSDLYILLENNEDEIKDDDVKELFESKYYADTTREAGGYFCHQYLWLTHEYSKNSGVLIINQRFDV